MEFPKTSWRLILTPPATGAWNMAADAAILEAAGQKLVAPTLRLFAWEPACLSLGYAQASSDVDLPALADRGWQLVRRPTGGRAILHTDELTYSVAGPQSDPRLAGSVLESYKCLSAALLDALQLLSVPAESQSGSVPHAALSKGPVCFEVPSNYEIIVEGKKLVGSAQARRKEGVLQHGSLPLFGDLTRITQVLAFPDEANRQSAAERLLRRATTVEQVLGRVIPWDEAAKAFQAAFQEILNLDLIPAELTLQEKTRTSELVRVKYGHPSWIERAGNS